MNLTRHSLLVGLTIQLALASAFSARGQSVLVPPPTPAATQPPPPPESAATNETESVSGPEAGPSEPPAIAPAAPVVHQPFTWGAIVFHPYASYQYTYGSGIPSATNAQHSTVIQGFSPGIAMNLGAHWTFDYAATFNFYSDTNFHDTINHSLHLSGATEYEDWKLRLSQSCLLTADPSAQTAQQTDQQLYATAFGAGYQLNGDMSLDLGFNQNVQVASGFSGAVGSSRDWSTIDWLNHQWGPNLSAGLGVGLGYIDVDIGANTVYEQLQGHASWQVRQKITLSVNAGIDVRQFIHSAQSELVSPIMGATLRYQPFAFTSLSLAANRSVAASVFQSQSTETTTVNAAISQRLLKRFYLGLGYGFANTLYQATAPGAGGREDTYDYVSVSLGLQFLKRGSASAFYTKSHNASNTGGFAYHSDQAGLQLEFHY